MIIIDFLKRPVGVVSENTKFIHVINVTGFKGDDKFLKVIDDTAVPLITEPTKYFSIKMLDEEAGGDCFLKLLYRTRLTKNEIHELIKVLEFGLEEMN